MEQSNKNLPNNKPTFSIYGIKDRNRMPYPSYTHDHNICLMQNGKVLFHLQLERYTQRKYDNRLDEFLEELIEKKLIELPQEFDLVCVNSFVGSCFISQKGKLRFETVPKKYLSEKLEIGYAYYQFQDWEGKDVNAYSCSQELAHVGACLPFFGNFKENSLLIHFDGGASVSNFSAFHFKDNQLKLLEYSWDLKYLSNFFNDNAFTFQIIGVKTGEHTSVPGKLMGYACLGEYDEEIETWLAANNYFKAYWDKPNEILKSIQLEFGKTLINFDNKEIFFQNVAATFQKIFERETLKKIETIQNKINADYLYYSGGCALNIITNTKLVEKKLFLDIFIPPCCNDSGLSLGGAALLEWQKGNQISIHSPYLNNVGLPVLDNEPSSDVIQKTAQILLSNGIVGVCNGNAEAGPRALGNRSLIALANNKELARFLSMEVKKREWYRPLAPVMLKTVAEMVVGKPIHHLSKFMLLDFEIKEEFKAQLEGVIHANNTARIQTISDKSENPFIFELLNFLLKNYGILGLINTSFNAQGEPIVHTPEMAIESAKKMNLNGLIVNNKFYNL